ncbi:hypothetical protein MMC26_002373 [Xylographa opegraphella]|nr:hypothetical protein [Xylographa opegraphella]
MDRLRSKIGEIPHGGVHIPGKGSNRSAIKGQVSGLMGRGKTPDAQADAHNRQSRPLAALQDPESFGPPPKNLRYYGGAAAPEAIIPQRSGEGTVVQVDHNRSTHHGAGSARYAGQQEQEAPPPPAPFKIDSTGLSTSNLPKPPTRHTDTSVNLESSGVAAARKPKPSLPPRLPPRQNSASSQESFSPASPRFAPSAQPRAPQQNLLNQGAINRLDAAGVSVPGFGIGATSESPNPWSDEPINMVDNTSGPASKKSPDLNELQSRFSKMSSSFTTRPESPAQGTTFAEKQAALKTASSFRNDPSFINLSDARNAASTANNFRERHGDQVASGWQSASGLNKKYGIANRFTGVTSGTDASTAQPPPSPPVSPMVSGFNPAHGKRPPPIPPKRLNSGNTPGSEGPPVPLASKPRS